MSEAVMPPSDTPSVPRRSVRSGEHHGIELQQLILEAVQTAMASQPACDGDACGLRSSLIELTKSVDRTQDEMRAGFSHSEARFSELSAHITAEVGAIKDRFAEGNVKFAVTDQRLTVLEKTAEKASEDSRLRRAMGAITPSHAFPAVKPPIDPENRWLIKVQPKVWNYILLGLATAIGGTLWELARPFIHHDPVPAPSTTQSAPPHPGP